MELDKNTMRKLRQLILFAILAAAVVMKYEKVLEILGRGVGLIFPFLMGAAIAFILNVPMRGMERHIRPGRPGRKARQMLSDLSRRRFRPESEHSLIRQCRAQKIRRQTGEFAQKAGLRKILYLENGRKILWRRCR